MKKIIFRGRVDWNAMGDDAEYIQSHKEEYNLPHDDWLLGSLVYQGSTPFIVGPVLDSSEDGLVFEFWWPVIPATVQQFTI